jgi:hypothetical protein
MRDRLRQLVLRYGLLTTIDSEHFYPSIEQAMETIAREDPEAADES